MEYDRNDVTRRIGRKPLDHAAGRSTTFDNTAGELMPLNPGTTLGPYEIASTIGAGGMGEVYKARDTRLDRTVAIKVFPEHVAS